MRRLGEKDPTEDRVAAKGSLLAREGETLFAGDGDRVGDRCEGKWTQLKTTQAALQSRIRPRTTRARVLVPAVAGSNPVAHSSDVPAKDFFFASGPVGPPDGD